MHMSLHAHATLCMRETAHLLVFLGGDFLQEV